MKISIDRSVIAKAVAWVARTLPARPNLPILSGIQLVADSDQLTIIGFDGDTCAKAVIKSHVELIETDGEAGNKMLVSGRLLADIINSFTGDIVTFATKDEASVEVSCGKANFALQTLPLNEYPELPQAPNASGTINAKEFAQTISQVAVAAGRDELLPVFTGIKIEIVDDKLSFMATDRYRMTLKEMNWTPAEESYEASALVPAKVLTEVARSMNDAQSIELALSDPESGDRIMSFAGSHDDISYHLVTRLLDGEFPKVRHVMDIHGALEVRMKVDQLIPAVKRVSLVAERNTPLSMSFDFDHGALVHLQGGTDNQAQGSDTIDAQLNAAETVDFDAVGFKSEYLSSALAVLGTPYVCFSFNGSAKPCLLRGLDDIDGEPSDAYKHVIMLMRLQPKG